MPPPDDVIAITTFGAYLGGIETMSSLSVTMRGPRFGAYLGGIETIYATATLVSGRSSLEPTTPFSPTKSLSGRR